MIHQQHKQQATEALEEQLNQEKLLDQSLDKKAGRPKKYTLQLPKSLEKDISLNTAAYSKARERVPMAVAEKLFSNSRIREVNNSYSHWYGYRVLIGDRTYVQMQDTERIREEYEVKYHGQSNEGCPQGLLDSISERGTGQVVSFKLSNRHVSELALFYEMIDEVPIGSVLLLDDLYNCYEIIAKCKRKGIEMLMPAKRERSYELIEVLSEGDEIIRITPPKKRAEW
jgi:hypothetical protein